MFNKHKPHTGCRNWPWPSHSSERLTKHVFRVNLSQISSAIPGISAENPVFVYGDLNHWPLTLTFKLFWARDQTRYSCEFGANPFSGSQDISYTNKKVTDSAKNWTWRSSLRAVMMRPVGWFSFIGVCALTLLFGWQEQHPTYIKPALVISKNSVWGDLAQSGLTG